MVLDKFRLIEEVKKRPYLWNCRITSVERNRNQIDDLWDEIGKVLKEEAFICRDNWHRLRTHFCNEAARLKKRVAKAKSEGKYDPDKIYCSWAYFDALRFVAYGRSHHARVDFSFVNEFNVGMVKNCSREQTQEPQSEHMSDGNSFHTENENDIEIMEYHKSDKVQYEKQNSVEIYYESDSDIEISENTNQAQKKTDFKNLFIPNESNNASQIISIYDSDDSAKEDKNKKTYTVSPNNIEQESEFAQNYAAVKEEPELQINAENEFITEIQEKESSLVSTPAQRHCSDSQKLTENNLNDQDYDFLYSFSSTTKLMTPFQTREFRASMKSLLVDIFPASPSLNILERLLLLPEDNDPDRKFLISFWPFLKSMPFKQNLQFRANMCDLVFKIISTETNF